MTLNESGVRPPLCTYRLNWAMRTSWGWWDDWDDTVLQTQDSKFEPWRSEVENATSRSRDSGVKCSGANHYPRAPAFPYWFDFRGTLLTRYPVSNVRLLYLCICDHWGNRNDLTNKMNEAVHFLLKSCRFWRPNFEKNTVPQRCGDLYD